MADAVERFGRRSMARRLNVQGNNAIKFAQNSANRNLKKSSGRYAASMRAEYTGLNESLGAGAMTVTLKNNSANVFRIEYGTRDHDIFPQSEDGKLSWPAERSRKGVPFRGAVGQGVHHPGQPALHIMENAIRLAFNEGFKGQLGRGVVRFSVR